MANKKMRITKGAIVTRLIEGEKLHSKDRQRAISQVNKMIANPNMNAKRLGQLCKLSPHIVRKFRRISANVRIV